RDAELGFIDQVWTSGKIDHDAAERFIERDVRMAESHDSPAIAERLVQGLAENPADVFNRVMSVDFEIAFRGNRQVEASMASQLGKHVVEKRDARLDVVLARAIKIQGNADLGFFGCARLGRDSCSHLCSKARSRAFKNRVFSSALPTLTRMT